MKDLNSKKSLYSLLSRREIQILKLIVEGFTDKEIALQLGISFNTIRTHHQNIRIKTGQHCMGSLIIFAIQNSITTSAS